MPNLPIDGLPVVATPSKSYPLATVESGVTKQTDLTFLDNSYLQKSNNLNDVSSIPLSLKNIGMPAPAQSITGQGSNYTQTNPIPHYTEIEFTSIGLKYILPDMTANFSLQPNGGMFFVKNIGTNTFNIVKNDTTTVVTPLTTNEIVLIFPTDISTANGTFQVLRLGSSTRFDASSPNANNSFASICLHPGVGTSGKVPVFVDDYGTINSGGVGLPSTNGQLIIGNTGTTPTLATIQNGTYVGVTNGAGSIAINDSSLGTIVTQNANNVNISGGQIQGTAIGTTSSSTGVFSNLSYIYVGGTISSSQSIPASNTLSRIYNVNGAGITLTMDAIGTYEIGYWVGFINTSSTNSFVLQPTAPDLINGKSSITIPPYSSVSIMRNYSGTAWNIIYDNSNINAINLTIPNGGSLRTTNVSGETAYLEAYDSDAAAYKKVLTLTAGNVPTLSIIPESGSGTLGLFQSGSNAIPLIAKKTSGQSVNIFEVDDDAGIPYFEIAANGTSSFLGIVNCDTWFQSDIFRQGAANGTLSINNTGSSISDSSIGITSTSGGITLTPALNKNITVSTTGTGKLVVNGQLVTNSGRIIKTRVVTAAGAATITSSDEAVVINKSVGASTVVNLPAAGSASGQIYIIKDGKGDAATNNITLTPSSGNIDGAATYVMSANYQSIMLIDNGTQYNII